MLKIDVNLLVFTIDDSVTTPNPLTHIFSLYHTLTQHVNIMGDT